MSIAHGHGGHRVSWPQLPALVLERIQERLGGPVLAHRDCAGGFSPGMAAVLTLADGSEIFVKAVGSERNPESPGMYRAEAEVLAALPSAVPAPRLLWVLDDGDWVSLGIEAVTGRPPRLPWREDELHRVLGAMAELVGPLTPTPIVAGRIQDVLADFDRWPLLAAEPQLVRHPWARAHLAELAGPAARWGAAAAGETLLHLDIRADNILLARDRVVFVDWPHVAVGAPWVDLVLMLPSMQLQGCEASAMLADFPPAQGVPADAVNAVLAAFAGFLSHQAGRSAPPGLPNIRAFQALQAHAALDWLQSRLG
jgi:aminoglycoside phosphotransferase (APT) family kinase protein